MRAVALREQGCHAEAAEELQDILSAQLQLRDGATLLDTLHTRQELAWALGRLGRWADAEDSLEEVILMLDQRRRQRGAEEYDARVLRLHARCRTNWAVGQQGRWPVAEQGYRRLLTDRIEVLGADHPDTLDVRYNIGKALAWQGRWAAAADEWRRDIVRPSTSTRGPAPRHATDPPVGVVRRRLPGLAGRRPPGEPE